MRPKLSLKKEEPSSRQSSEIKLKTPPKTQYGQLGPVNVKQRFRELMEYDFHDQMHKMNKALRNLKNFASFKKKSVTFAVE